MKLDYIHNYQRFPPPLKLFFPLHLVKDWKWTLLYCGIILKRSHFLCKSIHFLKKADSLSDAKLNAGVKIGPNSYFFSDFIYLMVLLNSHLVSKYLLGWQADLYPVVIYLWFYSGV